MLARLFSRRRACSFGRGALFLLPLLYACTNARLEHPQQDVQAVTVDDEVVLTGSFCASPAADVPYPVKVMFIVDGSGSQQFSDQNRQRVVAVENAINALIGQSNVYFKTIVFNAAVTATPTNFGDPPPAVFTNDLNELLPGLVDLTQADTLTDYQGALAVAYAELLRDITDVRRDPTRGPAELARTKYVIIFISDGMPDPQCRVGFGNDFDPNFDGGVNLLCEDQDFLNCLLQVQDPVLGNTECNGGVCDFNGTLCNENPDAELLFGGLATMELMGGADYNQPYQLLARVQDIMDLSKRYDVGDIRLHTGLVLDPNADPGVIAIFGDPAQAVPLMEEMANLGEGLAMKFYGGDQIDFLEINYRSLKQPRVVTDFYADNTSSPPGAEGFLIDTDGDGLTDAEELAIGTSPRNNDTDGDGYRDGLEWKRRAYGLDPLDPCLPRLVDVPGADPLAECDPLAPMTCNFEYGQNGRIYIDTDRDGLNDCEEKQLGTNPDSPDTDHDGLIDSVEVRFGTNPVLWDYEQDSEGDSLRNGMEVISHLPPNVRQSSDVTERRYRYDRPEIVEARTIDGRPCYDFTVRRVKLAPTIENDNLDLPVGYNTIRLYIVEHMADDLAGPPLLRTACLRARYVPPSLKDPVSGAIVLRVTDPDDPDFEDRDADERFFKYLWGDDPIFNDPVVAGNLFDPDAHCVIAE